jgi:hypothetical protein
MKPVVGIVVSNKMQKSVDRLFHNKVYNCYVKRTSKFMAHDEADECNIDDRVSSPRAIDPFHPPPPFQNGDPSKASRRFILFYVSLF